MGEKHDSPFAIAPPFLDVPGEHLSCWSPSPGGGVGEQESHFTDKETDHIASSPPHTPQGKVLGKSSQIK